MKYNVRSIFLILTLSFALIFSFRLMYGYITYPADNGQAEQVVGGAPNTFNYQGKNYASKKASAYQKKGTSGSGSSVPLSVDQKYEKVGTLALKSKKYESDEKKIRNSVKSSGALIQFEQRSGLQNKRSLHLAIGVVPEKFDALISELKTFGTLVSIRIDKVDKTNEYKMLQAKRSTLETTRKSLVSLKTMGTGSIEELISLEEKISQTESQIQDLGVNLGDYDAENEFCTVKCSLLEATILTQSGISLAHRIKVALEWTISTYLKLIFISLAGTLSIYLASLLLLKLLKIFPFLKLELENQVKA